jgi:hypothetical protein
MDKELKFRRFAKDLIINGGRVIAGGRILVPGLM